MSQKAKQFRKPRNKRAKRFVPKQSEARKHKQGMYNTPEWKTYRFRFLHHNPYCYLCMQPSRIVDHIKNHNGNEELFWNITNFMPMCKLCHDTVTGKFDRHVPQLLEEKLKYIENLRKEFNVTVKIKIVEKK